MGLLFRSVAFFLTFGLVSAGAELTKVQYAFSKEPIDVVIPCAPKDKKTLALCIKGIRTHGKNIRRVIVVSKEKLTDEAEWFAEKDYPFSKEDLATEIFWSDQKAAKKFLLKRNSRIGWIYQQFLKLYAPFVIPEISSNVLVLDADVIFLRPVEFMDEEGRGFLNIATEYHPPYFEHMKRLLPDLCRVHTEHSGITHHMLFQKPVLEDLFSLISKRHKMEPWKAICRAIKSKKMPTSCLSEYEIYFNFALLRTDQIKIHPWPVIDVYPLRKIEKYRDYVYITSHEYP